jgi:hypothetical protein
MTFFIFALSQNGAGRNDVFFILNILLTRVLRIGGMEFRAAIYVI